MGKRKCVICDKWIESNNDSIPYKDRYAHVECFNIQMKILADNKKQTIEKKKTDKKSTSSPKSVEERKLGLTEEEFQSKKKYYDYIKSLLKVDRLPAKVYKLSDDYIKKYNFDYEKMYKALYYYYSLKEHGIKDDCIGILPYCYDEAQFYYEEQEKIKQINHDIDVNNLYKCSTVKIRPPKAKVNLIDISTIGGDKS